MKKAAISILFLAALPTLAFADAQENRGLSYCSGADVVCSKSPDPGRSTEVCIFEKVSTAYVIPSSDGQLHAFGDVKSEPQKPGVYGAGQTYSGQGFKLHINTDVSPTDGELPANLSVPSLSQDDVSMTCSFQ